MKNIFRAAVLSAALLFSIKLSGQELLGETFEEVTKILNANGSKYDVELLEDGRVWLKEYSRYDPDKAVSQTYYFDKRGKRSVCEQMMISYPRNFYGELFWDGIAFRLKNDYESTNYVDMPLTSPVYRSVSGRFKTVHYMSMYSLDGDLIMLNYFLDTSGFDTKME